MRKGLMLLVFLLLGCGGEKKGADADEDALDDLTDDDELADVEQEDGTGYLWLDVGEVVDIDGTDGLFTVTMEAPSDGGEYVLIVFASRWDFGGRFTYTASVTDGAGGSGGSAERSIPDVEPIVDRESYIPRPDWSLLLEGLAGRTFPRWDTYPSDDPPTVDEVRSFQLEDGTGTLQTIDARCQIVTDDLAVWFDITSTPTPTVDELDEIARLYGDIVMPRERLFFGEESDYNEDGVVHVLFSPLVNENAVAYFHPCDLIEDPSSMLGCHYGNHAEMLYVSPPELLPANMRTPMALNETLAHETAHMIYFHRKFLLNGIPGGNENIYLNEALAALAQDLTGMTGGNFFVTRAGLDHMDTFRALDILTPGGGYASGERDGWLRGQSYMFLRYLYDQAGGETVQTDGSFVDDGGIAWLNGYVDSADLGAENIEARMGGRDDLEIAFDFVTCLAMSNRGPDSAPISDDPAYNFLPIVTDPLTDRTRGLDMFMTFRDMFSLVGPSMASIALNDGEIYSTGVEYLTFPASGVVEVSLSIEPESVPWVRLARFE